jgi:hypothetical protein
MDVKSILIEIYFLHNLYYLLGITKSMFIFNLFKHRKKTEELTSEKINSDSIAIFIDNELEDINNESDKFRNEIIKLVTQFSSEIKQKISELKELNLNHKREEQRLKEIVTTNLHDYISYLEKLTEDLEKIESTTTEDYIKYVQSVFNRFNKNSKKIYEKATILIGKELAEVKEIINNFAKEFNEKLASNKENFEKINLIKNVQDDLKELEETKKIQKQIENSIADVKRKITKIEEKKQLTEKNYEEYKRSNELKKFIEEQEKIKQENKIIDEDILKLKQSINLKDLAKNFHDNPKKSNFIKRYSENFYDSLKDDSSFEIISLAKGANQKVDEEKIKKLRQKILEPKKIIENPKIKDFESLLTNLDSELKYEYSEIEKEKEKIIKFEEKQNQILIKIKEIAKEMGKDFEI